MLIRTIITWPCGHTREYAAGSQPAIPGDCPECGASFYAAPPPKLCIDCQHFECSYEPLAADGRSLFTFQCHAGKYDLAGRVLRTPQLAMYLRMARDCDSFFRIQAPATENRGIPSGEAFGKGGSLTPV
jgi:hypothetical protein